MKSYNELAILKILDNSINRVGKERDEHSAKSVIVKEDYGYVLRVTRKLLLYDEYCTMNVTAKNILEWSDRYDGDVFKGYLKDFHKLYREKETQALDREFNIV